MERMYNDVEIEFFSLFYDNLGISLIFIMVKTI